MRADGRPSWAAGARFIGLVSFGSWVQASFSQSWNLTNGSVTTGLESGIDGASLRASLSDDAEYLRQPRIFRGLQQAGSIGPGSGGCRGVARIARPFARHGRVAGGGSRLWFWLVLPLVARAGCWQGAWARCVGKDAGARVCRNQ